MTIGRIEPAEVVQMVEEYVETELSQKYGQTSRRPLDEPGVWSLHKLAAEIYAAGWRDGERAEGERARRVQFRKNPPDTGGA